MPDERKKPSTTFERREVLERRVMPKRTPPLLCQACNGPIGEGQGFTMINLGPGSETDAREHCQAGQPYAAVIALVHWACGTGDATPEATRCALCEAELAVDGSCPNPECDLHPRPA